MKIRFESDDDLPLGKPLNILNMIIVFEEVVNIIHKFIYMNVYMSYKNLGIR